jgi:hypothetical protein
MKKIILTLLLNIIVSFSLSAQIKVDDWYIYNSSDFKTVVDKITKSLGREPKKIKKTTNSKSVAIWDMYANVGSKEFSYGITNSNVAYAMMTYHFYFSESDEAKDFFNTLYKKCCKEEGGEGKLRKESNNIGESIEEYKWGKKGYYKFLSIKS